MTTDAAPGPATAVVIVTHDVEPGVLARCVHSVAVAGGAELVVIVDNGGKAQLPTDVAAELVRAGDNRGFGAAANLGFRLAAERGFDRIALLNDDVEVGAGWLRPLHAALDADPRVGAAQPKLLLQGTEPVLVNSVGVTLGPDGAGRDIGFGEPDGTAFAAGREIAVFTGGAVLFRRELLDAVGGFDERYFLYYEDVDLALRGAELGWRYRCEPASVVWHAQGSSTSRIGDRRRMLSDRNRLWTAVRFGRPRVIAGAFWLSIRRLRHPPRRAHLDALLGGLAAVPRLVVARVRARSHG